MAKETTAKTKRAVKKALDIIHKNAVYHKRDKEQFISDFERDPIKALREHANSIVITQTMNEYYDRIDLAICRHPHTEEEIIGSLKQFAGELSMRILQNVQLDNAGGTSEAAIRKAEGMGFTMVLPVVKDLLNDLGVDATSYVL